VGLSEGEEFDATSGEALKKVVNSKSKAAPTTNTSELDHFMVHHYQISACKTPFLKILV